MEEARKATLEDLKTVIKSLNENNADYLLIGGYALHMHGIARTTSDIDILVPATEESGEKVKHALMVLPDKAAKDLLPEWFKEGETIRLADEIVVDIMFTACAETYESLSKYAVKADIDGVTVNTVDLEGLLLTKRSPRGKDITDREILVNALQILRSQKNKELEIKSNLSDPVSYYNSLNKEKGPEETVKQMKADGRDRNWIIFYADKIFPGVKRSELEASIRKLDKDKGMGR